MQFYNYFRFNQIFKNIIIFFPLIISKQKISLNEFFEITICFIIFSIIALVIYFINDLTDIKADKINKLKKFNKKKKKISNNKNFLLANSFLFFLLIYLYFTPYFKTSLIIYIGLFYLYNFFFKKVKYIDIIFLISFYICRFFYGAQILNIDLTHWFLLFFGSLFAILSIHKRVIQIKVNNLKNKNKIISYTLKDIKILNFLINSFTLINICIFIIYLFYQNEIFILRIAVLIIYSFILIYLINMNLNNKIKIDIYNYVFKDKKIIILSSIMAILTFVDYIS